MVLSDMTRKRFEDWGIEIRKDVPESAYLIFGPKTRKFDVAVALMELCDKKTVTNRSVEGYGDTLHVGIEFRPERVPMVTNACGDYIPESER